MTPRNLSSSLSPSLSPNPAATRSSSHAAGLGHPTVGRGAALRRNVRIRAAGCCQFHVLAKGTSRNIVVLAGHQFVNQIRSS